MTWASHYHRRTRKKVRKAACAIRQTEEDDVVEERGRTGREYLPRCFAAPSGGAEENLVDPDVTGKKPLERYDSVP